MGITIDGTTGISSVDGSAASPSVRGSDSNSGIVYAADAIKFSTGGTERFTITNTGFTGITQGITAAAQYRVTTSFTGDAAPISSNWEKVDSTGQGILGTWADPSSGVFTFPATGFYLVSFGMVMATAGQSAYLENKIQLTTDNGSNWHYVATGNCNISDQTGTTYEAGNYCQTLVDVTDTAQVKVRFDCNIESNSANVICNSTRNQTYVTLIRLGDT